MKIFISHSSKQKLLVNELRKQLPTHIQFWVDEKELTLGDNIENVISNAIENDCDHMIIIIDRYSAKSAWVKKEIEWALKREKESRKPFILPIVADQEAIVELDINNFYLRKYLICEDHYEESIRKLVSELKNELFSLLSKEVDISKNLQKTTSRIQQINDIESFYKKLSQEIFRLSYKHRVNDPLFTNILLSKLQTSKIIDEIELRDFEVLITKLQRDDKLHGIIFNGDSLYLDTEYYDYKQELYVGLKQRIAKKAIAYIKSGDTIALDAGTTIVELAKLICKQISLNNLNNLKIVTNSIPAASLLLQTSYEIGLEDGNSICNVFITGGRVRPSSLAVVNDKILPIPQGQTEFDTILNALGGGDIGFLGANGVKDTEGFAVSRIYEYETKSSIIRNSKRKFILTDPSKFARKDSELIFAKFSEGLEIITCTDGYEEELKKLEDILLNTSSSIITA